MAASLFQKIGEELNGKSFKNETHLRKVLNSKYQQYSQQFPVSFTSQDLYDAFVRYGWFIVDKKTRMVSVKEPSVHDYKDVADQVGTELRGRRYTSKDDLRKALRGKCEQYQHRLPTNFTVDDLYREMAGKGYFGLDRQTMEIFIKVPKA